MENSHHRNNAIEVIQSGDSILSDHSAIKGHIVNFYDKLFREEHSCRHKLDGLDFGHIDQLSTERLEKTFDEKEVLDVLRGMVRDKA